MVSKIRAPVSCSGVRAPRSYEVWAVTSVRSYAAIARTMLSSVMLFGPNAASNCAQYAVDAPSRATSSGKIVDAV